MAERFTASAARLAGLSGRLLSWPPDWFWQATPAELAAILFVDPEATTSGIDRQTIEQMMERERDGR
ncbi:MAG: phage tail assembly chaperone [Erythrobacter sp.]|nr:MAG: phage tail assembly chaperone [Erythrobacter sp.]